MPKNKGAYGDIMQVDDCPWSDVQVAHPADFVPRNGCL
jgi:hypothetical protein